jgi:RNA polymerase sigma-70 factor (ECF subfamily)
VTDPAAGGDQEEMLAAAHRPAEAEPPTDAPPGDLARIYEEHFDFVWRSARRLGVPPGAVDDVVQEVFIVVHRQLASFEGRSSMKTWLFGILRNVVLRQRRSWARRREEALEESAVAAAGTPADEHLAEREARRVLHALLAGLDDDKRAVFVLAELEQMSAPEIAEATGLKLNTVYSRLRLARAEMEKALERHRARERGGAR